MGKFILRFCLAIAALWSAIRWGLDYWGYFEAGKTAFENRGGFVKAVGPILASQWLPVSLFLAGVLIWFYIEVGRKWFGFRQLKIRAWSVDNEDNITTLGRVGVGKAATDMVCFAGITNPNQDQGLNPVSFHLISINPRLSGSKVFHPATQNHKLRAIRFHFTNVPADALDAGLEGLIRVFTATRYFHGTEQPKTIVKFGGDHLEPFENEFVVADGIHIMVTDATAPGVGKTRAYFKIEFNSELAKPVFTLKRRLWGFGAFGIWKVANVD